MIKKINRKLKYLFRKYKRIAITTLNKKSKLSDHDRWSQSKSLFSSWDERTKLLANQVQANTKVFEFGAAKLMLKEMLPEGCVYLHSDIVARAHDTIVVDLNKELPQIPKVDYIIFSGVLEYIFEVEKLMIYLANYTDHFVFSYARTNEFPNKADRRFNGWVSDLNEDDIKSIAKKLNMTFKIIGQWKQQTLYQFSK